MATVAGGLAGTVSRGITHLTMDGNYQKSKYVNTASGKSAPQNIGDGIIAGGEGLLKSMASGISGLVDAPAEGAKSGGFGGFIKGLGKGVVGAVTKPVDGVFEFVSKTTEGAVAQTKTQDEINIDLDLKKRKYAPRLFQGETRIMIPYRNREQTLIRAALEQIWANIDSGIDDEYYSFVTFSPLPLMLLFTFKTASLILMSQQPKSSRNLIQNRYAFADSLAGINEDSFYKCSIYWTVPFDSVNYANSFQEKFLTGKSFSKEQLEQHLKGAIKKFGHA
uniref:Uncharacterized protein n=1 Tax=Aplanochytrium stocchinoi TaxID=215587 RepID=A0A7S3PD65_9STRA